MRVKSDYLGSMRKTALEDFEDYFEILEVNPGTKPEEIRKAYRRLAKKYHPDTNPNQDETNKFLLIREAYEVLNDSSRKRAYMSLYNMMKVRLERENARKIVQKRRIHRRLLLYCHQSEDLDKVKESLQKFAQIMVKQWSSAQEEQPTPELFIDQPGEYSNLDDLIQQMHRAKEDNSHVSGYEYSADLLFPSIQDLGDSGKDAFSRVKGLLNDHQLKEDAYLIGHALYCVDLSRVLWPEDQFSEIAAFLLEMEKSFEKPMEEWELDLDQKDSRLDTVIAMRRMLRAGLNKEWIERAIPYKIKAAELTPLLRLLRV